MAIQRYLVVVKPSHHLPLLEHSRARLHCCSEEALALRDANGSLLILISCWSNLWNPPVMAKHWYINSVPQCTRRIPRSGSTHLAAAPAQ